MRKKYQAVINYLENKISTDYVQIAVELKNNIFDKLSLTHNRCAERTLAYFSNNIFIEYLEKYDIEKYIMSEVQVTPNIKLSYTTKTMYAKKVDIDKPLKKDLYNGILVPDTCACLLHDLIINHLLGKHFRNQKALCDIQQFLPGHKIVQKQLTFCLIFDREYSLYQQFISFVLKITHKSLLCFNTLI